MEPIIYHNPRCSKSRKTLELIEAGTNTPVVIEYLKTPPSAEELKQILSLLQLRPRELMRKNEPPYKENLLADPKLDDDALIAFMIKYPVLIERPIVICNGKAVIGRPPENVLDII